jgi:RNA polymerase sigma-70 factor (ECF subfamily)
MYEESDGSLVKRTCGGDRDAFAALVHRYERPVFNAALRMLHDREEARDVSQTVFLKVYEHLDEYDPTHKFYSWLYRIALNESINVLHRRRPRAPLDIEMAEDAPGPDDTVRQLQLSDGLAVAIVGLRHEYRAVIVLRHFLGCSYEDMASILAVPEKTVKSRLFTARHLLRAAMEAKGWTAE